MSYYTLYDVVESIKDDMNRIDFYIQNCPHHWGSDCLDKNTFLYNLMKRMEWKCNLFDRYTMEKMDMCISRQITYHLIKCPICGHEIMEDALGKKLSDLTSEKDPGIMFKNIDFHCPSCNASYTITFKYAD